MKKILIVAAVCVLLISGCEKNTSSDAAAEQFTYWTVNEVYKDYFLFCAEEWNKLFPERQLQLNVNVFNSDQIDNKLWTTLHSGVVIPEMGIPDLVDIEYQSMEKYIATYNCLLHPLNILSDTVSPESGQKFLFDAFSFRGMCFGIPYGNDYMVIYYNTRLLDAVDVDVEDIHTWSDLIACGKAVYAQKGIPILSIDIDHYQVFLSMLSQAGFRYSSGLLMGKSRYYKVMEQLEEMVASGVAILMPGGRPDSTAFLRCYNDEDVCAIVGRLSDAGLYSKRLPDLQGVVRIAALPQWGNNARGVVVPGYATAITAQCENYELLKDFLAYAKLGDEASRRMLKAFGGGTSIVPGEMETDYLSFYRDVDMDTLSGMIDINAMNPPNISVVQPVIDQYQNELIQNVLED